MVRAAPKCFAHGTLILNVNCSTETFKEISVVQFPSFSVCRTLPRKPSKPKPTLSALNRVQFRPQFIRASALFAESP